MSGGDAIGYVLKVFPRQSETFVINEILAMESSGESVAVLSLHHPAAPVTHATLGRMRADVTYVEDLEVDDTTLARTRRRLAGHFGIDAADQERFLPRKYVRLASALAGRARERKLGHLHAHFASRSAHVTALAAALAGLPYSITAHAKDIYHQDVDVDVLRWKMRHASFVATVTDYNQRYLLSLVKDSPETQRRIVRVYNGVDMSRFEPRESSRTNVPLVLGIGRLVEKKGFDVLVAACRILADRGARFVCEIIGGGELARPLQARIDDLGLGNVVSLCGALPTEDVARRLGDAAVLVAPCVAASDGNVDALPTVIIEAMASGVPVVSTRLSGIPEMIVEGETGRLVEPGDAAGLAGAIAAVIDDPRCGAEMGRCGRRRAEEVFDLYRNVSKIRRLIRESGVAVGAA